MSQLLDLVPIVFFVAVFFVADIYWATAALMIAVSAQVASYVLLKKNVSRELKLTFWASIIFGGLTLIFRNELFIQWKPTIVNWLFAAALLGSRFIGDRTLIERMMGSAVTLDTIMWRQLNLMWVGNFSFLGAANLYVVNNFDEATWVNFKLFGMLGLTLLMAVGQALWIAVRTSGEQPEEG